jgi:hypothetical protein
MTSDTASISVPPARALLGLISPPLLPRLAVGVGQLGEDKDPLSDVRGSHRASADNAGTGGISESVEISEHETKALRSVPHDVFEDDSGRPDVVNESGEFRPEPALILNAAPLAGG